MHSPKNCLPGSGWEVWQHGTITVPIGGQPVTINRYGVENGPSRMTVLYWYQTSDRIVADEYYAKAFLIRDALLEGRTSGSIVRIALPDEPWALNAGVEFTSRLIPMIQACLPRRSSDDGPGATLGLHP
jgi:EpsI family protein